VTSIPAWANAIINVLTAVCKGISAWVSHRKRRRARELALERRAKEATPNVPWRAVAVSVTALTLSVLLIAAMGTAARQR
jgi:hypothetical protein